MYVRVLWGRLRQGMWDEYERYYSEHIEPVSRGMEGFRGRQLLQSTESPEEGMSITMWDTLEALRGYDADPRRQEVGKGVQHMYTGKYWVRNFEIKMSTV